MNQHKWNTKDNTKLDDLVMIAGDTESFTFDIRTMSGLPYDLTTCKVLWTMTSYYDKDVVIIQKNLTNGIDIVDNHLFKVLLKYEDTRDLEGDYFHQIDILTENNYTYTPAQGKIKIKKRIGNNTISFFDR